MCIRDSLNRMKTQFGQSSNVPKRFFQMLRVTVQKMPFILTGHFGIFGFFSSCFSVMMPALYGNHLTNSPRPRVFTARPNLRHLCHLDNQPSQIGSHALHCAVLNNIVWHKEMVPCLRLHGINRPCLLYTSPSPRDGLLSRMPSSA